MLKPVSILALDEGSLSLATAVQLQVAAACGLEDLVQARELASGGDVGAVVQSIQAQRQRPDSPLRARDDISTRELILLVLSASGPARATLLVTANAIRELYEMRRLASFFTIEALCLLPEVVGGSPDDHAAAYGLLKELSAADPTPFNQVWLLDATNASRVRFGALDTAVDVYADAIAGALTLEPEMSGALPGIHPRGMRPAFSAFGYAELVFPREAALQRLEPRFAAELVREKLVAGDGAAHVRLAAKQFIAGDAFAVPLSRIGIDAGQSLFRRFQPKTHVDETTRGAEEVIAAVRGELATYRDHTHLANLETLSKQGEQTASDLAVLLSRSVDETLDRDGYRAALGLLEALVDPLPDLRADGEVAPRNLVTEIGVATAALDVRLGFTPDVAASSAARKRVRELDSLLQDQRLVADTLEPVGAAEQLAAMESEKAALTGQLPEILFAEESANNAARGTARDVEAERLGAETGAREQTLRELFEQLPRGEQALREALEERRVWLWRQLLGAASGVAALYGLAFALDLLYANLRNITWAAVIGVGLFAIFCVIRYLTLIAPRVRDAREALGRIRSLIETTDKAIQAAHNEELKFEYDVAHRRTTIHVLRRMRELAKTTLDALRVRFGELQELAGALPAATIATGGMTVAVIDDADVDAWYERTAEDRRPFVREFPIRRSESRHLAMDVLRERVTAYAATAFTGIRALTLAGAAALLAPEAKLAQRLKRFVESQAPLIELRDDDLPAQQAMQRDTTVWLDDRDGRWLAQLQRRFPEAHLKSAPDTLRIRALSRVLHFPGYVLGQVDYYRAQYEAASQPENVDVPDLVPMERTLSAPLRTAYEQVLLGRAVGVIDIRDDGRVVTADAVLGDSHLAAAQRLAASDGAPLRERLDGELAPRLTIAVDVERDLRRLLDSSPLSLLDRSIVGVLVKRFASEL